MQPGLGARDTNAMGDVYQWEEAGTGGCDFSASYSAQASGCLSLISLGQSLADSEFVEASPSGADAFFTTASSLLPQDYGLVDLYDAREGGGLPTPPLQKPDCEGEACQNPAAAPEFSTPSSSTFSGAGNIKSGPAPCARGKVRRNGKCIKRRKGQRKHSRNKRQTHSQGAVR